MRIKERIAAEKKAAQDILAKGEENLTDEEFEQLKQHVSEAKKLEERAALLKDGAEILDNAAEGKNLEQKKEENAVTAKSIGEHFANELKAKGLDVAQAKTINFETSEFNVKAATDVNVTGGPTGSNAPYLTELDTPVFAPRQDLRIIDLFAKGTMGGQVLKYPVYGKLEGKPGATEEGKAAAHTHFPDPTWESDTLHTITDMWEITDDMIDDLPYVVSEINDHNDYEFDLVKETDIWTSDGSGVKVKGLLARIPEDSVIVNTSTEPLEDRIFTAVTMIKKNVNFAADGLVISPEDYKTLRLKRDKNGQYYGGGFFLPPYNGTGTLVIQQTPWGLPTVVTPTQAKGDCVVGAFFRGGKVLSRGTRTLKTSDSHKDNFETGVTAFRLKERCTLQVKHPYAFVKVSTDETKVVAQSDDSGIEVQSDEPVADTETAKTAKTAKATK
nr:MAG TPA: major capsid protein [Caudoviricetes sp.]